MRFSNVPNPGNETRSPSATARRIEPSIASTASPAARLLMDARAATWATMSGRFISLDGSHANGGRTCALSHPPVRLRTYVRLPSRRLRTTSLVSRSLHRSLLPAATDGRRACRLADLRSQAAPRLPGGPVHPPLVCTVHVRDALPPFPSERRSHRSSSVFRTDGVLGRRMRKARRGPRMVSRPPPAVAEERRCRAPRSIGPPEVPGDMYHRRLRATGACQRLMQDALRAHDPVRGRSSRSSHQDGHRDAAPVPARGVGQTLQDKSL